MESVMSFKEELMNSTSGLTAADAALLTGDTPDLLDRDRPKVSLIQTNSPELVPGEKRHVAGAVAGGFVIPHGDERKPVSGFTFMLLKLERVFNEYQPGRGSFVAAHAEKPRGAVWLDAKRDGVEKTGLVLQNGNRVVETISAYILIDGRQPGVFDFYSTALSIGRDLGKQAYRLRVNIDGTEHRSYTLGKWRMGSTLEKKDNDRYFKPVVTLLGKLGEPEGPTIEAWRFAQKLRLSLKAGNPDWVPAEAIEPPPPPREEWPAHPANIADRSGPRGLINRRAERSEIEASADRAPLPEAYDGPDSRYGDSFDDDAF
jgi:hypothetical protein